MSNEKCNLTWHNYSDHLKQMLHNLMNDNDSQDVTLVCDDKVKIKAHKIVLKACSPVFENILENINTSEAVVYLRGIDHQEVESVLQFMYLGEATFYQDRMNEFLSVAKILEIKELDVEMDEEKFENIDKDSKDEEELIDEDENIITATAQSSPAVNQKNASLPVVTDDPASKQCPDCGIEFSFRQSMLYHHRSAHLGVRYPCNQCDYKATARSSLTKHTQSVHEGVRYPCSQCDYKATTRPSLTRHILAVHEGVRYPCNQCQFEATTYSNLLRHIKKNKH